MSEEQNREEPKRPFRFRRAGKRKVRQDLPYNSYYDAVSERFSVAQAVLYILLLVFVISTALTNLPVFAGSELYDFLTDFSAMVQSWDVTSVSDLVFAGEAETSVFLPFRGGIAVAGTDCITIFSATGHKTLSSPEKLEQPAAIASGRYLIVYDRAGKKVDLYNTSARIFREEFEYTVSMAALSENGAFAVVTEDDRSFSVVRLYNVRRAPVGEIREAAPVTAIAMNADGSRLAIATAGVRDGVFCSEVSRLIPGEKEFLSKTPVDGYVYTMHALSDGGLLCLTEHGLLLLEEDGSAKTICSVDGKALKSYSAWGDTFALLFGGECFLWTKESSRSFSVPEDAEEFCVAESAVFFVSGGTLFRYDSDGNIMTCSVGQKTIRLAVAGDDAVYLCTDNRAKYIRMKE